jgi:ornithine cyclodeaminase/alanine dehydrogenase-like protein (mu-crystallin family)
MNDGGWSVRYLTRADVVRAAERVDPVALVRTALEMHADGRTSLPDEAYLPWRTDGGAFARSLALPGAVWGSRPAIGLKLINSSLANPDRGLPRAQGLTVLFDRDTGYPTAIMEAAYLSALRTSAYTALSVEVLGSAASEKVAVIGCGALGEAHVRMLAPRLPGAWFALYDTTPSRSDALVARLTRDGMDCRLGDGSEHVVRDAAVVVTTTTVTKGYLPFDWLTPGALVAHVSLDDVLPDVVARANLVVVDDWQLVSADDRRLLGRLYRSGELLGPKGDAYSAPRDTARTVDATLVDVVAGRHPGRTTPEQIILSNPFGMGILDVALAADVFRVAGDLGLGVQLPI